MGKQITADQALALSFTPIRRREPKISKDGRFQYDDAGNVVYVLVDLPRFIKPGEAQRVALKRLRSSSLGRTKQAAPQRRIPSFIPGKTTTAEYVASYERLNNLIPTGSASHLTHPAPINEGPDVVEAPVVEAEELCADLV